MINSIKKKAALELSISTIVILVIGMSMLILGIVLVKQITTSTTGAISAVDAAVENQIQKLFAEEQASLIIYPPARDIIIIRGDDPKGFAFGSKNGIGGESQTFTYTVSAKSVPSACGQLTVDQANAFLIGAQGSYTLGPGASLSNSRLVRFVVPKTAPACSLFYDIDVVGDKSQADNAQVLVTFK